MLTSNKMNLYWQLMRFDKPIGIWLLLWPTLWALWLASGGLPPVRILAIFVVGVVLMRAAGCVISDFFDSQFDKQVQRTIDRPLAAGRIQHLEALILFGLLSGFAFLMVVLLCRHQTIQFAMLGACLVIIYPLLKRMTHLPQLGLGVAFSWGIPMAFIEVNGYITPSDWFLFVTAIVWPVIYDTFYAMVDREDDCLIGVKSTALLFDGYDIICIAILQCFFVLMLVAVGLCYELKWPYYFSIILVCALFIYQLYLARQRTREKYFQAFINNQWVGLIIFCGIYMGIQ